MVDKLSDYIIRPARRNYNPDADLGPSLFTIDHKYYGSRIDFEVMNRRNKLIKASLFHHNIYNSESYPLVVYCHGNSGNRTYCYEIAYRMLREHVSVLAFDFAGCGNSEGKYIFLGYFEQYDIDDVLEFTLKNFNFIDPARIGIWGRSMGAVAALMFASRHPSVSVLVLDSPFKDFSELVREYINRFKVITFIFGKYLYRNLRKKVLQKTSFDFEILKPIEEIRTCKAPAFFFTTTKDKVVPGHHSKELFKAYPAEKEYYETKGGHNTKRTDEVYEKMVNFIKKAFANNTHKEELWKEFGLNMYVQNTITKPNVKINCIRTPKPVVADTLRTELSEEEKYINGESEMLPLETGEIMYTQQSVADLDSKHVPELSHKFMVMDNDLDDQDILRSCRDLKISDIKDSSTNDSVNNYQLQ